MQKDNLNHTKMYDSTKEMTKSIMKKKQVKLQSERNRKIHCQTIFTQADNNWYSTNRIKIEK